MAKFFIAVLFSLLILVSLYGVSAQVSYDDKNTLESIVTIKNTFKIVPMSGAYTLKYINATISAYPRSDSRQIVSELTSNPYATFNDGAEFMFNNPVRSEYTLSLSARVTTRNNFNEIKEPVLFPIKNLDSSLYAYTQPTEIIDVNPKIKNLASDLIADKTDLYEIEYTFAEYVRKNIAYDLSTLTSDANQKSSWVLENKRGVCDEITNLFISLNRAAGIPTRFVSGISYTNLDDVFGQSWVPHAWAEVYYPGVGWIPYDVTYGQYGFIDAGHIKLGESLESSSSNIDYTYLGNDVKIVPGEIETDVDVLNYGEHVRGNYAFDATVHTDEVGFGSYDVVSVEVKNTHGYYVVADLYMAETQNVEIIEASKETVLNRTMHRKQVLLKPYETKNIYWLIRISSDLNKNYVYTFPLTVYNTYNETSTTFVTSRKDYPVLDDSYFDPYIDYSTAGQLPYSNKVYLECTPDKDLLYLEDSVAISCNADNFGDRTFDNVDICIDDECTNRSLGLQKIPLEFTKRFTTEGLKNIAIKISGKDFMKVNYVTVNVLDKPKVSIGPINYPSTVNYGDQFDITFTLAKESKSSPKDLRVVMQSETNRAEWVFPEFADDKVFTLKSKGDTLKPNKNDYTITVTYSDEKNVTYSQEQTFTINSNAKWYEDILLYINLIGRTIEQAIMGA